MKDSIPVTIQLSQPKTKRLKRSSSVVIKNPNPILRKAGKVFTWRWRLQLAINAPFGLLWVADKTNPAVHAFDMSLLAALHAEWLAPMIGIA